MTRWALSVKRLDMCLSPPKALCLGNRSKPGRLHSIFFGARKTPSRLKHPARLYKRPLRRRFTELLIPRNDSEHRPGYTRVMKTLLLLASLLLVSTSDAGGVRRGSYGGGRRVAPVSRSAQ